MLGDRGSDVVELQEFLISNGFLTSKEENYGVKTKRAVLKFQESMNLTPSGEWDSSYYTLWRLKHSNVATRGIVSNVITAVGATVSSVVNSVSTMFQGANKSLPKGKGSFTVDYIPCYVYNMNTGTMIQFGVSTPEEISDSTTANFEDQAVKGRSSPFKAYDNSGPRSISFTIELVADYCPDGIVQTVNKLRALCYPHKKTIIVEPKCRVVIGNFLKVTCVPTAVDVVWKKPYKDNIYTLADVTLSLSEVESAGTFASEVE